jgi:hypothetical protein
LVGTSLTAKTTVAKGKVQLKRVIVFLGLIFAPQRKPESISDLKSFVGAER